MQAKVRFLSVVFSLALLIGVGGGLYAGSTGDNTFITADPSGELETYTTNTTFDQTGAFFQSLGTNGRACVSCHQPSDAMSVTPPHIQARFIASGGTDPIFRPVDGATCPTDDVSTVGARRQAYSMLLNKGLIRVSMPIPDNAEFTLVAVDDPYNCASASNMSLFRRPLPATNLRFLSAVMWDGRESGVDGRTILGDLEQQAIDATLGHAQATAPPSASQLQDIVGFETSLYTAQMRDLHAGPLTAEGATGGPVNLSQQNFFLGINDVLSPGFDPVAMTVYPAWASANDARYREARRAVAHGEEIFNTRPIMITGVKGLNDVLGMSVVAGTCTTCHDAPNVGDHSVTAPLDIGLTDASRRTKDMPLYTLQCNDGTIVKTTDPGRAMITGKCADIGKFKGAILRGLAGRAPYFHNGSAATLEDAVNFYNQRFGLKLSAQDKADLVAFLKTL
jgi:cytochrome c peroxidase